MTVTFSAFEFETTSEAIQHVDASGRGCAIQRNGENLVVNEEDANRLAAAGIEFAYLYDHAGQIITVPVN